MSYRTSGALAAVLVIALAATVIWQVVESRALHQRMAQLEQEISRHREQLDEQLEQATTQASRAGIAATVGLLDATGFHAMEVALDDGELNPRFPEAVGRALTVVGATDWPERLQQPARSFMEAARSLNDALQQEDLAAARQAVALAHDRQHLLSHEVYELLNAAAGPGAGVAGNQPSGDGADVAGHASAQHSTQEGTQRSAQQSAQQSVQQPVQQPEQQSMQRSPEANASLEIGESGGAVGGAQTFRTSRGEQFSLGVTSAAAGFLHLHGYSLEWELEPGSTLTVSVDTDLVGRFPFELHPADDEAGIVVGYLEVMP